MGQYKGQSLQLIVMFCSVDEVISGWRWGGAGREGEEPDGWWLACLVSDLLVHDLLPAAHGALDDVFGLAGQLLLHLTLGSPQHEGPQHLYQGNWCFDRDKLPFCYTLPCLHSHVHATPVPGQHQAEPLGANM